MDDRALIRSVADRLEALAARTTSGEWRVTGLLASRPEVVARVGDVLGAAVAGPLVTLLRVAGGREPLEPAAVDLARELAARLP